MEKKLFAFFIPLCIIGFLGFWISTMFVGEYYDATISVSSSEKDVGDDNDWRYFDSLANESFTAEMLANPEIELNFADVNATVMPYDGTNIMVEVRNAGRSKLKVDLRRIGDKSSRISIESDSLLDFGFGLFKLNIFDGLGDGISKRDVTIKIPRDIIYEKITITQGSGETKVNNGINAREHDIDIGSGKFTYEKSNSIVSQDFEINLGSGEATFKGIYTKEYEINIGSGELNIENLTGKGRIDMGSGSANINFEGSPNGSLDMGSGYMKMTIPRETSTTFNFDIGSGTIDIENGDHIERYGHQRDGDVVIGNGGYYKYDVDLGSGKIDIAFPEKETVVFVDVVQSSFSQRESEYRSNN